MISNIIQLVRTEIKKFRHNATVSLLFILFTAIFPFIILTGKHIVAKAPPPFPDKSEFYTFPNVWEYQGYVGNWLVFFFLGFIVLHVITSEVSFRTMRQNIITGYTRWEYYLAKVGVIFLLAIYATLLYFLSTLIIGLVHTPGADISLIFDNNWAIARFFLMSLGYMSFALLVSVIFRGGGLSLFIYFAYALVLEFVIKMIHLYFLKHSSANYWPLNTMEDLMAFPPMRMTQSFINTNYDFSLVHSYSSAIIVSSIYTVLFFYLSWRKLKTSNI